MTQRDLEFSNPIALAELPRNGSSYTLVADEDARRRIAKRLSVMAVDRLEGVLKIKATAAQIFLTGALSATLARECVASLEEMTEQISEDFEVVFSRTEAAAVTDDEDEAMAPDIHEGDEFDLGEFLVQQLSLAMDPFPRKKGAASLAEKYGRAEGSSALAAALGEAKKIK